MNNLKLAVRRLLGAPFVTGIAVVSLALGIGVNAALFTLFSTVLLRPLPVPDPETLVNLAAPGPKPGSQQCWRSGDCEAVFSYLMFRDLERDQTPFTGIAAHKLVSANLAFGGQTQSADAMLVSGSYFTVLGLRPALGRLIGNEDDKAVGQSPVAVISHAYWRTRFDASQNVINQTLVVNGQPMTIIGVTPPGFEGTTLGAEPKVYVPITLRGVMQPGSTRSFELRQHYWVYLFARRKAGVTIDEARSSINVLYHNIVNNVEANLNRGLSEQTFARFLAKPILVEPGARGQSLMIRETRQPMTLLMAVAGLVLVIACANIANLLLVRAAARASEMAVRLSLGANRSHLITQLLVESCLLSAIGGAAGLLVARWTLGAVSTLLPAQMAAIVPPGIDGRMLLTATVLSLGTGLLFGLFPALHASRPDLAPVLKGHSGQPSGAKTAKRFRLTLATAQIALSMALLVGAGLFTRSLYNVSRVELGVRTDKLVTFSVTPQMNGYSIERSRALFERLETDLSGLPGVTAVSASLVPTLSGVSWGTDVAVEGFKYGPDINSNSRYNAVGAGYFATMGMPLLAGREFTAADRLGAPQVAIVNESFTKKFNLGTNAVGKRMGSQRGGSSPLDTEIIAIVKDAKYAEVKGNVPALFFVPYLQDNTVGSLTFYVRTSFEPEPLIAAVRGVVARLDANLPVDNLRTMEHQVQENISIDRLLTILSASFAVLATLLAAVGLYGVLAYTVAQRTREIGLRLALGAAPANVRRMILRQVGLMTLIGGFIGLTAGLWIASAAKNQLFQMEGPNVGVFAAAAILLGCVAITAGLVPAHRASRVDPMTALRYE